MNQKLLCLLLALCVLSVKCELSTEQLTETQSNIDRATELLQDLLQDAKNNLSDLENNWAENKRLQEQNIANQQNTLSETKAHCQDLENQLADYSDQLQKTKDYIEYLQKRIVDNLNKLDNLNQQRCQKNQNFVRDIKNFNLSLSLIKFLRNQIQQKDSFSLMQKKALMQRIQNLFQLYETHDTQGLELLQEYVNSSQYDIAEDESVKGRSEQEIGTGHLDNNRENLALQDFPNGSRQAWGQYKQQLLDVLQNFENVIEEHKKQAQEDEINSVLSLAEFQAFIENENKQLAAEIEVSFAEKKRLENLVDTFTENSKNCREEQRKQEVSLAQSEETLSKDQASYDKKHASIQDEIDLLKEVIDMYSKISSTENDFKQRVDDVSGGIYSDGYDQREVPKFDLLNGY